MPVRIYDISKKLGLENKEVLTKAKELGIAAARVASSSLDKITAEYLEEKLRLAYPNAAAAPPAAPTPAPPQHEPIRIVSAPPPEAPPQPEVVTGEPPEAQPMPTAEAAGVSAPVEAPMPAAPPAEP